MSKQHDENQDVRLVSLKCKVNYGTKVISAPKDTLIGNKTWGRIDYLCHYCGFRFMWGGEVITKENYESGSDKKKELRIAKKAAKEHKLSNKTKRTSKKE